MLHVNSTLTNVLVIVVSENSKYSTYLKGHNIFMNEILLTARAINHYDLLGITKNDKVIARVMSYLYICLITSSKVCCL